MPGWWLRSPCWAACWAPPSAARWNVCCRSCSVAWYPPTCRRPICACCRWRCCWHCWWHWPWPPRRCCAWAPHRPRWCCARRRKATWNAALRAPRALAWRWRYCCAAPFTRGSAAASSAGCSAAAYCSVRRCCSDSVPACWRWPRAGCRCAGHSPGATPPQPSAGRPRTPCLQWRRSGLASWPSWPRRWYRPTCCASGRCACRPARPIGS